MIVHTTFTDGYFNYSKLFLESFVRSNGQDIKMVLTTTDLPDDQVRELKNMYKNLDIYNKPFDYTEICKELNLSKKEIKHIKNKVEHKGARRNEEPRPRWKMHVAAEKRVKKDIPFVMNKYSSEDFIAHFDIDMYFKKDLTPLFNIMADSDFSTIYRPEMPKEWRRIWMCVVGIKPNEGGYGFINAWGKELDKIPLKAKPFAYGQTSCYRVYKKFLQNDKVKLGVIPGEYVVEGSRHNIDALIWSGNNAKIGKDNSLNLFWRDFNEKTK